MELNKRALDAYEASFLEWCPDDKSFESAEYFEGERNYKDELYDDFQSNLLGRLLALPDTDEELLDLGTDLLQMFYKNLKADGKPQNLVGWRYTNFGRQLDDARKIQYVRMVAALLDETRPIDDRLKAFQEDLESIAEAVGDKCGPAMKRSVATFYLFLFDPKKYVFVKTHEFGRSMEDLAGKKYFGAPDEYSKILEFIAAIRTELEARGWRPKDLIDVQSFLWSHHHKDEMKSASVDSVKSDPTATNENLATDVRESGSMEKPINEIIYGPPGTGKTYQLKENYFPIYTDVASLVSEEERMDALIGPLTWYQVIAAVLYERGNVPTKVPELVEHPFVSSKIRYQGRSTEPNATVWVQLQIHTPQNCPSVNYTARAEPYWFWKSGDDSRWTLVDDWQDSGQHVVDVVDKWKSGPDSADTVTKRYDFVTFHQSYSYEEFVEGIRPEIDSEQAEGASIGYRLEPGIFKRICDRARRDPDHRYALFIDEINRGNISKIFGELITLVEVDKRSDPVTGDGGLSVTLPYSGDLFSVPANLDVIGTMNTADRSLAHIDTALRRRFEFTELRPDPSILKPMQVADQEIDCRQMLAAINRRIEALFDREHMIGHAYLINQGSLREVFEKRIIPLLVEYFFEDWSKVRAVLADDQTEDTNQQFILADKVDAELFGPGNLHAKVVYSVNDDALDNPDAYRKIYEPLGSAG